MIFCIARANQQTHPQTHQQTDAQADRQIALPSWKKILSCRQSRALPQFWHESRLRGEDGYETLILYEYRGQKPARDIPFLLGCLWQKTGGFQGAYAGVPVIILHNAADADVVRDADVAGARDADVAGDAVSGQDMIIHNPVITDSGTLYPDIILGHTFHEEALQVEPASFLHYVYVHLFELLSPHQVLGFSINLNREPSRMYRLINMLKDYAQSLDELCAAARARS
ncbi:MAG: hypothetical protein ACR2PY_06170 [Salinispira sp.]